MRPRASAGADAPTPRCTGSKHPHPNIVQAIGAWEARDGKLLVVMGARRRRRFLRCAFSPQLAPAHRAEFMAHSLRVKRTVNKVRRWFALNTPLAADACAAQRPGGSCGGSCGRCARAGAPALGGPHTPRRESAQRVGARLPRRAAALLRRVDSVSRLQVSADYKVAKLADFGLARPLVRRPSRHDSSSGDDAQGEGGMTPRIGPRKYRAPEVEAGKAYGTQVDMYSYGVMIRELLEQLKGRRVRRYGVSYDFLRALGRCCMREEPAARPTALDALACLQHHQGAPLHAGAWGDAPLGRVAAALLMAPPPSRGDSGRKRKRSRSRDRGRERERDSTDGSSSSSESIDRLVRLALVRGGHALDESDSDADD